MCRVVPLLPIYLRGVVLKDRNMSLGVRQDEVGNDPADDHTIFYCVGKFHCHLGSEIMFSTAYIFFFTEISRYQHMIISKSASMQ